MKKIISILIALTLFTVAAMATQPDKEFKLINSLNYHQTMFNAMSAEPYMAIPFGNGKDQVAGAEQDLERLTVGVPFAFRANKDNGIWILDSVNKALKLFDSKGKFLKQISLSNMGTIIRDFAMGNDGSFWLLNQIEGFIYHIDASGKLLQEIEGFQDALVLEASVNGGFLVDLPAQSMVLKFGKDDLLEKEFPTDGTLSLIEDSNGKLLGLTMEERKVEMYLRTLASPASSIVLAQFPLEFKEKDVTFAGAEIIGKDGQGNIYLSLTACNEEGAIFMDRLYKCSAAGKVLAKKDILTTPFLGPDLPRRKIVTPDGQVITFYATDKEYCLVKYKF